MPFLPMTIEEMNEYGWDRPDFVYISGDSYIDHPSFGPAIITRVLENFGYKTCIISQPNINKDSDFTIFPTPRLGFIVSSGNIDSMVNHYTVSKRKRDKDYYTPNGEMGKRPDRAVTVYSNIIRRLYPEANIMIGGIEASLRRLTHYDYWSDTLMKSILLDSKADLLMYGMGEKTIVQVADALDSGLDIKDIIFIRNTVWKCTNKEYLPSDAIYLPTHKVQLTDKYEHIKAFNIEYVNTDPFNSTYLVEEYDDIYVVQNPPEFPLSREEMDAAYSLPYERDIHPLIKAKGHVPAIDEVQFSIISNRGCYGACNFCALTIHQGRIIQSRSSESIIEEAKKITKTEGFKGYIHDIGGPTANFYNTSCKKQSTKGVCQDKQCLGQNPCAALEVNHEEYLNILRSVRNLDNVKKVFVRSGLRYDYIMYDKNEEFFNELVEHHVSGQLKVAPEHISQEVLIRMGKPSKELYDSFTAKYQELNKKHSKKQYLIPYLMSSHPGSTLKSAIELAEYLKDTGFIPDQVQDFYPTPATASTIMYYTGVDPFTLEKVYVAKSPHEKAMQRALVHYKNPKNYDLVYEALVKENRRDLIGFGKDYLIPPRKPNDKPKFNNKHKKFTSF